MTVKGKTASLIQTPFLGKVFSCLKGAGSTNVIRNLTQKYTTAKLLDIWGKKNLPCYLYWIKDFGFFIFGLGLCDVVN